VRLVSVTCLLLTVSDTGCSSVSIFEVLFLMHYPCLARCPIPGFLEAARTIALFYYPCHGGTAPCEFPLVSLGTVEEALGKAPGVCALVSRHRVTYLMKCRLVCSSTNYVVMVTCPFHEEGAPSGRLHLLSDFSDIRRASSFMMITEISIGICFLILQRYVGRTVTC
jgi:hypothetical protein